MLEKDQRHKKTVSALLKASWDYEEYRLNPEATVPEDREPFLDRRMVEFILSLPEQPWTHKKHLLRSAMKGRLPSSVLERPKEALKGMNTALFSEEENPWIYQWKPSDSLEKYIDIEKVRKETGLFSDEIKTFINIRMIVLEKWLSNLSSLKV